MCAGQRVVGALLRQTNGATMTKEQHEALVKQAAAQLKAAGKAVEQANKMGLKGKSKTEFIARAIEKAAKEAAK